MLNFFKKKTQSAPKRKNLRFFRWQSLNPNEANLGEILALAQNTDPDLANARLRNQARSLSVNNSLTNGFFDMLTSEILGEKGITLSITSGKNAVDKKVEWLFNSWCKECCPYGVYDFLDIEEMALISFFRDGEAFIHLIKNGKNLKIELLDAAFIDNNYNDINSNIKCGIEREENSLKPKFYYFRKNSDSLNATNAEVIKIPASDILHIKKSLIPTQRRGISKLASAVLDINQKDKFLKAERDRARLASELTAFISKKENSGALPFEISEDENHTEIRQADVGKIAYLNENEEIKFVEAHAVDNITEYLKMTDREVARSLGVSYATLTGDLKEVNYSSIRQGVTSERRSFRRLQGFLKRKFNEPIFKEWLKTALINNQITSYEYNAVLDNFSFKPQGWEYIDPTKEVNANKISIESGFKTISEVLREKGIDIDDFLKDIENDKQIIKKISEINTLKVKNENQ